MDILKKIWPTAFKVKAKDTAAMIIQIVVMLVIALILPAVLGFAGAIIFVIPVVGPIVVWALGIVGSLIGLYALVGIVLCVLNFLDVLK